MSMNLKGLWENSYGSQMNLTVDQRGGIVGVYSSTTGSTGKYNVIGHCSSCVPDAGKGLAVVLSIYWRSVGGDPYDGSWHWVSTYCGQLLDNGEISVINSLVATTFFSGFSPGDYIDKLTFTKSQALPEALDASPEILVKESIENPINGCWYGNNVDVQLELFVTDKQNGLINGRVEYQGVSFDVYGFTDTHIDGQINRQSISVCGCVTIKNVPVSLSGFLDLNSHYLELSRWVANSTAPEETYFQADVESWLLSKK